MAEVDVPTVVSRDNHKSCTVPEDVKMDDFVTSAPDLLQSSDVTVLQQNSQAYDNSKPDSNDRHSVAPVAAKNGTAHVTADRRSSSGRSHSSRHSRQSSRKQYRIRSPEHSHRNRKNSPLPSHSRLHHNESPQSGRETNHKSELTALAEKRTRIVLQIYEEIVHNGRVVDSKVNESEYITSNGTVSWPSLLASPSADRIIASHSNNSEIVKNMSNCFPKQSSPARHQQQQQSSSKGSVKLETSSSVQKRSQKSCLSSVSSGKKVKVDVDGDRQRDRDDEDSRIEMASTLLSLQTGSPVKKEPDNFNEIVFRPLKSGNSVMAKWTDKNFYAGNLASNLGDGRWHVLFEDGGKKAVNESDIISVPHLTIGQTVMATFSDGSLCLKGMVKQPFHEKNRLFYLVEYNDGSKTVTEKFSRRDIFLTSELAATLLNRQSKGSDKLSKFADVDLNNIIPKRSRLSALSRALDGSTDGDSEPESISSSHRQNVVSKVRKPIHHSSKSPSSSANSKSTPNKLLAEPEASSGREREEVYSEVVPEPAAATVAPSSVVSQLSDTPDLLGPIPEEGSILFQGFAFLLTTADAGNSNDSSNESGRSSVPFDIPHLIKQIEAGGGCVHQTLEHAQESNNFEGKIILLAGTFLRTVKYMQCLAAGIPCIKHVWLIECCRRKELLNRDDYLLPSGYSITSNSLISDRNVLAKSKTLFNGVRFMLVSKNPRHAESWTSVLTAAKAVVVEDFPSSSGTATRKASNSVDVIISDSTCPITVIKRAQHMRIPIVSSEYVVQCLINGCRLPYDAHDKFGISTSPSSSTSSSLPSSSSSSSCSTVPCSK